MERKKFSPFLVFLLSFIPGIGLMYMGLNRRGVQLFTLFLANIFLSQYIPQLTMFMSLFFVVSIFDTLQVRRNCERTGVLKDEFFLDNNLSFNFKRKWIGTILVSLGVIMLLTELEHKFIFLYYIKSLLFPLVLITFGIYLLKGRKLPPLFEKVIVDEETCEAANESSEG